MEAHDEKADELERQADGLEEQGDELEQDIDDVRSDFEGKLGDPQAPGLVEEEEDPAPDGTDEDD